MKRIKVITALQLIFALLTACSNQSDIDTGTESISDTDSEPEETTDIYADLPTGDFGGEEFVFANELESKWAILTLNADEINGELINDAVYKRNRLVEERLNVKFRVESYQWSWDLRENYKKFIAAGDDPYDVVDINANLSAPMVLDGSFIKADELSLDLTKPWWNKTVMDSLTFAGNTYSLAGDISIMLWDASLCFMFNKTMSADLQLTDHYDLVREGKWTFDAAEKAMKAAARDLNGNTERDTEDCFGLTANLRLMSYLLISGGETIIERDKEGLPSFSGMTQSMTNKFEKIYNVFFDNDDVFISERGWKWDDSNKDWHSVFVDGQALYFFEPIGSSVELRDSNFDYGFMPLPKYDEAQEDYITPIIHFAHVMHVSKCNNDLDKISAVLENLAAESYKSTRPAYFDHIIDGKRVQDDSTIEMFEIMFANQVMNPACIYDWGGICSTLNDAGQERKPDIASQMAVVLPKIQADIQKTIDFYSNN